MRSVPSTAVPWLEKLVAGISQRITGFDPRSIHVIYGGQSGKGIGFFPEYFGLCQYHSINFSYSFIHIHAALTRRTNGPNLGTF
jgi:hypothetical protein